MKATNQTLMHQMHISMQDIERRKQLLGLTDLELAELASIGGIVAPYSTVWSMNFMKIRPQFQKLPL
jgi:hypothetical protein